MTFAATDRLSGVGAPVELYEFTIGNTVSRFTSAPRDYSVGGVTYTAVRGLDRGEIRTGARPEREEIQIVFPMSNAFARSFFIPSYEKRVVRIRQVHRTDADQEVVTRYQARVTRPQANFSRDARTISLVCETLFSTLRRRPLSAAFQKSCRHALYGPFCGVNLGSFQISATASESQDAVTFTVAEADNRPDGYYTGGVALYDGIYVFISSHVGDQLTMLAPFIELNDEIAANGDQALLIAPGCPLRISICNTRFNNSQNFGGFPYIPDRDIGDGSAFT